MGIDYGDREADRSSAGAKQEEVGARQEEAGITMKGTN